MRLFQGSGRSRLVLTIAALAVVAAGAGIRFADSTSAAAPMPPLNVLETNRDAGGNIRVHEQGTVPITGTVNVGNTPAVQDVNVTNARLEVSGAVTVGSLPRGAQGSTLIFHDVLTTPSTGSGSATIGDFAKVRISADTRGGGSFSLHWSTDGDLEGDFEVDDDLGSIVLPDVPGTKLTWKFTGKDPVDLVILGGT